MGPLTGSPASPAKTVGDGNATTPVMVTPVTTAVPRIVGAPTEAVIETVVGVTVRSECSVGARTDVVTAIVAGVAVASPATRIVGAGIAAAMAIEAG